MRRFAVDTTGDLGSGMSRLHEGDPAEPVVGVRDLPGVAEPGVGKQCDDAVAVVAGHDRTARNPGTYVPDGVDRGWASEVDDSDRSARAKSPQRVARKSDPAVVIDVVQGQ